MALLSRIAGRKLGWFAAALPLGLFATYLSYLPGSGAGGGAVEILPWIPSLDINLAFRADGLGLLFALLVSGIGTFIFLYAGRYLAGDPRRGRFFAVLTAFMAAMLGTVLSDDVVVMLIFWELTSVTSFLLIGYEGGRASARRAAEQGLMITVGGGLALLVGVLLLAGIAGTYSLSGIIAAHERITGHHLVPAIIALIAVGAFAKSAQFPLHAWLPNAMEAPTPVSAFLHSATMVKLGIYLLARFNPLFSDQALWVESLGIVGALTMVTGAVLALRERDLKRVLAYSTIVSLGTLVALIGVEDPLAVTAAVTFLIVHALYKACLFLVAGIIDHETGTRDATRLRGLRHRMPVTAVVAVLASLSMAGLPPFMGFIAKELIYTAKLASHLPIFFVAVAVAANAVMVTIASIIALRIFFGTPTDTPKQPHDPPAAMLLGPVVLAALGLAFGVAPNLVGDTLLARAEFAMTGSALTDSLTLWHGFTAVFWLSMATLGIGLVIFLRWDQLREHLGTIGAIDEHGVDALYDRVIAGLHRTAGWLTGRLQHGGLRLYVWVVLVLLVLAVLVPLRIESGFAWPGIAWSLRLYEFVTPILLVVGAAAVVVMRTFLRMILAAGVVGFTVALIFMWLGAPDLAFTQFAVETLFVTIMVLIVVRMNFREPESRTAGQKMSDRVIAGAVGVAVTTMTLAMLALPLDLSLSDYFNRNSLAQAHGANVVNVIIVDFRALDTLGEITVLVLAACATFAVMRARTGKQP